MREYESDTKIRRDRRLEKVWPNFRNIEELLVACQLCRNCYLYGNNLKNFYECLFAKHLERALAANIVTVPH